MWKRTKNMLPAKPATRSPARSDKVLCSRNSCSCFAMESICDCVCVEFSLIKPLFSLPSEVLAATQALLPFLITSEQGRVALLAGRPSAQKDHRTLDAQYGGGDRRLPTRSSWLRRRHWRHPPQVRLSVAPCVLWECYSR